MDSGLNSQYHGLHAWPRPSVQLTLLASAPPGGHVHAAHRCAQGGMRRFILIALCFLVVPPPPTACLLAFSSYKVWVHGWRGNFCFWTTEFFICSDQISCEKEEANKWSSCMPCSHSACRGLEGTKALLYSYPLVVSRCFSGGQFTCLPASGHVLRLACSQCLNMHVC